MKSVNRILKVFVSLFFSLLFVSRLSADDFILDMPSAPPVQSPSPATPSPRASFHTAGFPQSQRWTEIAYHPTFMTLGKGNYSIHTVLYQSGGVGAKLSVGMFDTLDIGISFYIDDLVGSNSVHPNIPGAYIKWKVVDNYRNFNLSLGFDCLNPEIHERVLTGYSYTPSMTHGLFVNAGWSYPLLFFQTSLFMLGVKYPLIPVEYSSPLNTELFGGTLITFNDYFQIGATFENLTANPSKINELSSTFKISIMPDPQLEINLNLQYLWFKQSFHRTVSLSYEASF